MDAKRLLKTAIIPALIELEQYGIKNTLEARRLLLAIALQESGLKHRRQVVNGEETGAASGYFQFEKGGGCAGVLAYPRLGTIMQNICSTYGIGQTAQELWTAIQFQDIVAAAAARILIYTLPNDLPKMPEDGWAQYVRAWRPGKPRPETWAGHWATATAEVY